MKYLGWVGCAGLLLLAGCGKFFPPLSSTSSGSGSSGTSNAGDYLYVANSEASIESVAGFSLASGALSVTSGSAYATPIVPTTLAITPNNDFLYVASTSGAIYVYVINSNGSITLGNSGTPVVTGITPAALTVDTTGNWLIGVDAFSGVAYVFQIAATNGALTNASGSGVALASASASQLAVTPDDAYVYVTLSTGGVQTLSFDSANGALAAVNSVLPPKQNLDSDLGVAVSPSGTFLFVTETGINSVRVLAIASNGTLSEVSGSPFATGLGPDAVVVDATGTYAYVANRTANTVSAFTVSSAGALTPVSGSPFATGTTPVALVEDNTKTYLAVVNEGGSPDLQVYTFSATTPGALVPFKTATTGTDPTEAIALAATH